MLLGARRRYVVSLSVVAFVAVGLSELHQVLRSIAVLRLRVHQFVDQSVVLCCVCAY